MPRSSCEPYQPDAESHRACDGQQHGEWRGEFPEEASGFQDGTANDSRSDPSEGADHPGWEVGSEDIARRRAIARAQTAAHKSQEESESHIASSLSHARRKTDSPDWGIQRAAG